MPNFRERFASPRIRGLLRFMQRFLDGGGERTNQHFESALSCLIAYRERHLSMGVDIDDVVSASEVAKFSSAEKDGEGLAPGGVRQMVCRDLFESKDAPFGAFVRSRVSSRHFDPDKGVEPGLIDEAVRLAICSPSVCNRQGWRVHCLTETAEIKAALSHQNGNRGFGERIRCLLIVTADLTVFDGVIERYQYWIDGGMFSMTLLLSLHHAGLGTVPLNWSALPSTDRGLRKDIDFPESESVIMMIGVGHPVGECLVPISSRRGLDEVLIRHGGVAGD